MAVAPAGQHISCKLRVAVGTRSRIISVRNENDVVETITDLMSASKRDPEKYLACVNKFWKEYGQCVRRIVASAGEGEAEERKAADAVRRVKASADQLFLTLRPELDSMGRSAADRC